MRILAVSDVEDKYIWDFFDKERFKDIDLIVSCGDLRASYLEFLVTMIPAPLIYVHGNHDTQYDKTPPGGCYDIEDKIYEQDNIKFLGLGGCMRYRPDSDYMYTEIEMQKRIKKINRKIKKFGGVDILVTHSPAYKIGDGDDRAHIGFQCFVSLIDYYKPKYMLHGHQHQSYNRRATRLNKHDETTIINVGPYYILEL